MKIETLTYTHDTGWSRDIPTNLDSEQTLALIFCSPTIENGQAVIQSIRDQLPNSHLVGCSTAGEIYNAGILDESVTLAITQFELTQLNSISFDLEKARDSHDCGVQIGKSLNREDLAAVLILSVGTNVNGTELVAGINAEIPPSVPVTGGLAADGERFEHTWVIHTSGIQEKSVVAVGLYGKNLKIGFGSMGGWDIFGPSRRITRSQTNVLYELDGKPALELYKEYLGERAEGLPATALLFPLALHLEDPGERDIVRTVLGIDEMENSMTFAGDMPEGALAQMMKANFDRLIDGAMGAAVQARESVLEVAPILSIAISCVGRRLVLGSRTEEELEVVLEALPPGTAQIGFYSYGEFSPSASGYCDLHNQTMTLTTISEGK